MFHSGKVPHAMMVVSSNSMAAAMEIAAAIVCREKTFPSCGICVHCIKSKKNIHPDMITIAGKASIQVDQIREMRLDAHVLPNDGDRKVYVIQEAQTMTESAQNAFLKILEQPPTGVYFILAVSDRRGIIDTIRSRVVEFTLKEARKQFSVGELSQALLSACRDRDELKVCAVIDKGFANDRTKAQGFVSDFIKLLNEMALRADNECEKWLALYDVAQDVAIRLDNAGNVSLCAAYFSIQCLEAVV
jgi:replication-associated recombination protein RarA